MELIRYRYRKMFHLSAEDMEKEPADELFTNLVIYGYDRERREAEIIKSRKTNGNSKH